MINSRAPKLSCRNVDLHDEHLWAAPTDPEVGVISTQLDTWYWAHCRGIPQLQRVPGLSYHEAEDKVKRFYEMYPHLKDLQPPAGRKETQ